MGFLAPAAAAVAGEALLSEGIGAALASILPVMEGTAIPGSVALGTDIAMGGTGASTLPFVTGLGGISSASLGKGAGGLIGATGGSALNASLEGMLKGGEAPPKLPTSIPNFIREGKGGVLAPSPSAANMIVPTKPSFTVGMRVGSQEDLLRRLLRGA